MYCTGAKVLRATVSITEQLTGLVLAACAKKDPLGILSDVAVMKVL